MKSVCIWTVVLFVALAVLQLIGFEINKEYEVKVKTVTFNLRVSTGIPGDQFWNCIPFHMQSLHF